MFGGPGKMGRGGGGVGKRNIHGLPISRTGRPSMGGGPRCFGGAPPAAISSLSTSSIPVDESFRLRRENPLYFGMAIKLAPDLVEEIKRVEAQGGGARIKFDVNANNPNGNVIHVGDKIFRFTWSREPGDLCDIYEESQRGEDGNGLLVESGGTWRKLNVERELDESTKNHVKRRSEEAERKHKSRKAIVLDPQSPSMKNQVKALAAAESNPWRNFKNRKEPPFKKAKLDPPSGGPPKFAYKSSMLATTVSKEKISSGSPLSSQPELLGGPASPAGNGNLMKGRVDITDAAATQNTNMIASSEKEMPSKLTHSIIRDKSKRSRNTEARPADLKSLVISLLQENQSKGMSLKGLEKAIGEVIPNSAREIDPILKQVAVFQSPGRYLLKQGLEKEGVKKPPSQSGSSPATNRYQPPSPKKPKQLSSLDLISPMTTFANNEQAHGDLNSITLPRTTDDVTVTDKTDMLPNPPQRQLSDLKAPSGNSSSNSSSSSDSDRNNSGSSSPSHSHSDSKSNDASISSRQASDEDVDIMSDEEPQGPKPSGPHLEDDRVSPLDANSVSPKRFGRRNLSHPVSGTISSLFGDRPRNSSPDRPLQSLKKRPSEIMVNIVNMDDDDNDDLGRVSVEARVWAGAPSGEKRSGEVLRVQEGLNTRDRLVGERRPANGCGSVLQREYSDLELGEFREPVEDATPLPKEQIERNNSSKQMENMSMDSACRNFDPSNSKINVDVGVKSSPQNSETLVSRSGDGPFKRKALENNVYDFTRLHKKNSRSVEQLQQGLDDHMETESQLNRALEMGNKSRFAQAGPGWTRSSEGHGDVSRRMAVNSTEEQQQHDTVRGVGPITTKVSKKQKPNVMGDSNGRPVDASSTGTHDTGQQKKESFSDEGDLFAKYEKEEAELKGPIKDTSEYKEYVKEYQDKYEKYCSLKKILKDYRDKFTKYGKDLEICKGRDMERYNEILKQMKSSFHQCGEHLKQMIKDYVASYK